MKPVMQTILTPPLGDCLAACIASLLELPLTDVPNFCGDAHAGGDDWMTRTNAWLAPRGLGFVSVEANADGAFPVCPPSLCILSGKSPRGTWRHSVVGKLVPNGSSEMGFEFLHDPHPAGGFIEDVKAIDFLCVLDPARRGIAALAAAKGEGVCS